METVGGDFVVMLLLVFVHLVLFLSFVVECQTSALVFSILYMRAIYNNNKSMLKSNTSAAIWE